MTRAPAALARSSRPAIAGIVAWASGTRSDPPSATKSFCMSTTTTAVLERSSVMAPASPVPPPPAVASCSITTNSLRPLASRSVSDDRSQRQRGWRAEPCDPAAQPWLEDVRGGHPRAELGLRPGVAMVRGLLTGEVPPPPLSRLTGLTVTSVGAGSTTFALPLSDWLADGDGEVGLGPLTVAADAAMACAAITLLPPRVGLTTAQLSIRRVRPVRCGGLATATAKVADRTPAGVITEVSVSAGGRVIAHGSSLCVELPEHGGRPPAAPGQARGSDGPARGSDGQAYGSDGPARGLAGRRADRSGSAAGRDDRLDPWRRPVPAEAVEDHAGALGALIGLRVRSAGRGTAVCSLPATRWLCAPPPGRVQGGWIATLAESAIAAAIRSQDGLGRARVLSLELNILRALASDGAQAVASARVVHAGRRVPVASAEVHDARGRLVALATGSATARL